MGATWRCSGRRVRASILPPRSAPRSPPLRSAYQSQWHTNDTGDRESHPLRLASKKFGLHTSSAFYGELENVLNIEVQQGNSLDRETLAGLSGHFIAECRQDIPRYFELAP